MSKTILTEVDGWTPLIDDIVQAYGLVTAAVFGRMWRYCQMKDGVCVASQERIGSDLGLERNTVNKHIEILVKAGYLRDETPDVRHRPHVYSDTGKAGIKSTMAAFSNAQGVQQMNTSKPEGVHETSTSKPEGVHEMNTSAQQMNTRCSPNEHPGVHQMGLKIDSSRDSSRNESKESARAKEVWSLALGQIQNDLSKGDYKSYLEPCIPERMEDGTLIVRIANAYARDWIASRCGARLNRIVSGIVQQPVQVRVEVGTAQ